MEFNILPTNTHKKKTIMSNTCKHSHNTYALILVLQNCENVFINKMQIKKKSGKMADDSGIL